MVSGLSNSQQELPQNQQISVPFNQSALMYEQQPLQQIPNKMSLDDVRSTIMQQLGTNMGNLQEPYSVEIPYYEKRFAPTLEHGKPIKNKK